MKKFIINSVNEIMAEKEFEKITPWIKNNFIRSYGAQMASAINEAIDLTINEAGENLAMYRINKYELFSKKFVFEKLTKMDLNLLSRACVKIPTIEIFNVLVNKMVEADIERLVGENIAKKIVEDRRNVNLFADEKGVNAASKLMFVAKIAQKYLLNPDGTKAAIKVSCSKLTKIMFQTSFDIAYVKMLKEVDCGAIHAFAASNNFKNYGAVDVYSLVKKELIKKNTAKTYSRIKRSINAFAVNDAAKHLVNKERHEVQSIGFETTYDDENFEEEHYYTDPTIITVGWNEVIEDLKTLEKEKEVKLFFSIKNKEKEIKGAGTRIVDNGNQSEKRIAFQSIVQARFRKAGDLSGNLVDNGFYLYNNQVYVVTSSNDGDKFNDIYSDFFSNEELLKLYIGKEKNEVKVSATEAEEVRQNGIRYRFFIAGAGDNRNATATFLALLPGESYEEFVNRLTFYYDKLTGGLATQLIENGFMPKDKLFKALGRFSLPWTSSSPLGKVTKVAYAGTACRLNGCNPLDGRITINSDWLAKAFAKKGVKINKYEALGVNFQGRASNAPIKFFSPCCVSPHDMETIIKENKCNNGLHLKVQTMSPKEFTEAYMEKDQPRLKSFITLVGTDNPSEVEVLLDPDNMKEVCNFGNGLNITMLAVSHKSGANLNSQIINNDLVRVPGALNFIKDKMLKDGIKRIDAALEKEAKKVIDPEGYCMDQLFDVAPHIMGHDQSVWFSSVKNAIEGINSDVAKFKIKTDGVYAHTTGDFSAWFGTESVHEDEIFLSALGAKGVKDDEEVAAFRNPKVDGGENCILKNLGLPKLVTRINNNNCLSKNQKKVLVDMYMSYDNSIAVYGPYKSVPTRLGGADHDYDGITVLIGEIVSYIKKIGARGVNQIENHRNQMVKFSYEFIKDSYKEAALNINPNAGWLSRKSMAIETVGVLSDRVSLFNCLLNSDDNTLLKLKPYIEYNLELRDGVLPNGGGMYQRKFAYSKNIEDIPFNVIKGYGKDCSCIEKLESYVDKVKTLTGINIYDIGDKEVHEVEDAFIKSDRSIESFRTFLSDVILCYAAIIGRILDAAKKGDKVDTFLAAFIVGKNWKGYRIKSRKGDEFAWVLKPCFKDKANIVFDKGFTYECKNFFSIDEEKKEIKVTDPLSQIRDEVLSEITEYVNAKCTEWKENSLSLYVQEYFKACALNQSKPWFHIVKRDDMKYAKMVYDMVSKIVDHADVKKTMYAGIADMVRSRVIDSKIPGNTEEIRQFLRAGLIYQAAHAASYVSYIDQETKEDKYFFSNFWTILKEEAIVGVKITSQSIARNIRNMTGEPSEPERQLLEWDSASREFVGGYKLSMLQNAAVKEDDVIEFVDGISTDGLVFTREAKASGKYVIKEIDGTFYATKFLNEMFKVPEAEGKIVIASDYRRSSNEPELVNEDIISKFSQHDSVNIHYYVDVNSKDKSKAAYIAAGTGKEAVKINIIDPRVPFSWTAPGFAKKSLNGSDNSKKGMNEASSICAETNGKSFVLESAMLADCIGKHKNEKGDLIEYSYKQAFFVCKPIVEEGEKKDSE